MYLENIFKSADVKKALPAESTMFEQVNKFFVAFMAKVQKMAKARSVINSSNKLIDDFKLQNANLDHITKMLQIYLETKRNAFPRFYFLSDDELLEILANSQDISIVQGYLKALFDGIVKLTMSDLGDLTEMKSKEGENLPFLKLVKTTGPVEGWLCKV
jgi:dynein heavy chain